MSKVYCSECGSQNDATAGFCSNCGSKLQENSFEEDSKPAKPVSNYQADASPAKPIQTRVETNNYSQTAQNKNQPVHQAQGHQQQPQDYQQQPPQNQQYPQNQRYQQGFNPVQQNVNYHQSVNPQTGYRPLQKPYKDTTTAYLIAFFIPGGAFFYTDRVGAGIIALGVSLFTYFFFIGLIIHLVLFLMAGSIVKDYNRKNGYSI